MVFKVNLYLTAVCYDNVDPNKLVGLMLRFSTSYDNPCWMTMMAHASCTKGSKFESGAMLSWICSENSHRLLHIFFSRNHPRRDGNTCVLVFSEMQPGHFDIEPSALLHELLEKPETMMQRVTA